ncbi:hypothetical protein [Ideonella livida]|uniref:Uncharacterized protein n=1 Tax=Ideonella livida TaxID=2707176 RepID=A0A7C9PGY1_9BURK|nr:hypothetical protein [Ideonella livida]NDY90754.1 hypothetical protein [Ideonella livida]
MPYASTPSPASTAPAYRCRLCNATCYRRLVERSADGRLGYGNRYRCAGCGLTFEDPAQWWGSGTSANPTARMGTPLPAS